jgi:galactokinase
MDPTSSAGRQFLEQEFTRRFGAPPVVQVRVPGRVNLIGEHTDYHDGYVLPMAIERSIVLLGRPRADRTVRVHARVLDADLTVDLDATERHDARWAWYYQGVIQTLGKRHPLTAGGDVLIDADLPAGGGLSSSSALVVGFTALLARLQGLDLEPLDLALIGRDAEHWYGTTGGIMDQFVISHARADQAVLIDCRTLQHEYVGLPPDVTVVVAHTGTEHDQIVSPFAARRQQAEAGLQILRAARPEATKLRDVDPALLEAQRAALLAADPSGVLWRRCHHVVTENARVLAAAAALQRGDLAAMGALMAASHASLRDDYEVSCAELDAMVEAALASPGCVGARMTGGGFGGCTVNLVATDAVTEFTTSVRERYHQATGIQAAIFPSRPAAGVQTRALD